MLQFIPKVRKMNLPTCSVESCHQTPPTSYLPKPPAHVAHGGTMTCQNREGPQINASSPQGLLLSQVGNWFQGEKGTQVVSGRMGPTFPACSTALQVTSGCAVVAFRHTSGTWGPYPWSSASAPNTIRCRLTRRLDNWGVWPPGSGKDVTDTSHTWKPEGHNEGRGGGLHARQPCEG